MIQLEGHLSSAVFRATNLEIFDDPDEPYLRSGAYGTDTHDRTRQRIRSTAGAKLHRIYQGFPEFDVDQIPWAWSWYVARCAGTHPFPDANHRTALATFDHAMRRAVELTVSLPDSAGRALVDASKRVRDPAFRERGRYYTIEELADEGHEYRQTIARFRRALSVTRVASGQ